MVLIVCGVVWNGVRVRRGFYLPRSTASKSSFGGRAIVEDTLVDAADAGADEYGHGEVIDRPLQELSRPKRSSFTSSFPYLPLYPRTQNVAQ
jgi:hypothetical protein